MMKRKYICVWLAVLMALLVFCGCNGTATENGDLKGQVDKLNSTLDETRADRDLLKQDVARLEQVLDEAESDLAGTRASAAEAKSKFEGQVQDLTKSRDQLNAVSYTHLRAHET